MKTLNPIFKDVQIFGIRAKDWIEEIERERVRQSPWKVYGGKPLFRLGGKIIPPALKTYLKKERVLMDAGKDVMNDNGFDECFRKFSMDDFYLEKDKSLLDKSLSLFAICEKKFGGDSNRINYERDI